MKSWEEGEGTVQQNAHGLAHLADETSEALSIT
jgi:hypothetical protein